MVFARLGFFSKKRSYTHTHTLTTTKKEKKRRTKELEEEYKQWRKVFFLSNTPNIYPEPECPNIFIYSQRLAYPTEEKKRRTMSNNISCSRTRSWLLWFLYK